MALRANVDRQTPEVRHGDESLMIANQPAHNRSTYCPDDLDIEVSRGVHCLTPQAPGQALRPGQLLTTSSQRCRTFVGQTG